MSEHDSKKDERTGRDERGCYVKGTSGNPRGRPRKLDIDDASARAFGFAPVEAVRNGRKVKMTRRGANLELMWAAAKRGNVHAQIFLERQWLQGDQIRAENIAYYEQMLSYYKDNPNAKPSEAEKVWLARAQCVFNLPDYPALRKVCP